MEFAFTLATTTPSLGTPARGTTTLEFTFPTAITTPFLEIPV
jgi:hypothetical protein